MLSQPEQFHRMLNWADHSSVMQPIMQCTWSTRRQWQDSSLEQKMLCFCGAHIWIQQTASPILNLSSSFIQDDFLQYKYSLYAPAPSHTHTHTLLMPHARPTISWRRLTEQMKAKLVNTQAVIRADLQLREALRRGWELEAESQWLGPGTQGWTCWSVTDVWNGEGVN